MEEISLRKKINIDKSSNLGYLRKHSVDKCCPFRGGRVSTDKYGVHDMKYTLFTFDIASTNIYSDNLQAYITILHEVYSILTIYTEVTGD